MYTTRQVAELLDLTESQVRCYARSGFLSPSRGRQGAFEFDFQDLVVLRTAVRLTRSNVLSHRRVRETLGKLRGQLGLERSLTEVGMAVTGERVLVQDGDTVWDPDSGQMHFNFAPSEPEPSISALTNPDRRSTPLRPAPAPTSAMSTAAPVDPAADHHVTAQRWYELGCEREDTDPDEAMTAYRRAIALDPSYVEARINLGRLLHQHGRLREAVEQYTLVLAIAPTHGTAAFNLALVCEDLARPGDAIDAYLKTIDAGAHVADAHYNLACLYERTGDQQRALRHFGIYKRMGGGGRPPSSGPRG